ncbi:conserved hypothetical protein [Ricinus communis]|uniref:Uncharacterized protein n=1 Tax=Ricinus communis TaxID=3988 RepID=B9T0F8_RICCO|nr:conserved hypothetical protein [Ricinus communis]
MEYPKLLDWLQDQNGQVVSSKDQQRRLGHIRRSVFILVRKWKFTLCSPAQVQMIEEERKDSVVPGAVASLRSALRVAGTSTALYRVKRRGGRLSRARTYNITHEIPEGPLHPPTEGPSSTNCYHPWADNTYSTFLTQSRTGITDPKNILGEIVTKGKLELVLFAEASMDQVRQGLKNVCPAFLIFFVFRSKKEMLSSPAKGISRFTCEGH